MCVLSPKDNFTETRVKATWTTLDAEITHYYGIWQATSIAPGVTRARAAVAAAGAEAQVLGDRMRFRQGAVVVRTMHRAKGLEYRAVAVMACDDEIIPSQTRIEAVSDEAELEEVYQTERHLLYVACTRARDRLLLTATAPGSEFLEDLVI